MTTTVSEFKGQVSLSSDAGTNTTIGNSTGIVTVNGNLRTNKITSTGVLYINETTNLETAINSNTTVAQNLTIGTPTYTTQYLRGTTININEFGSGNTVIGTSGGTGTITINRPLTSGLYGGIGLTVNQIGYRVQDVITLTACATGGFQDVFAPKTLPAGVWLINYSIRYLPSASTVFGDTFTLDKIDGAISPAPPLSISGTSSNTTITTSGVCFNGTFVVPSNGSTTYTVVSLINFSGVTVSVQSPGTSYGSSVWRTRIA